MQIDRELYTIFFVFVVPATSRSLPPSPTLVETGESDVQFVITFDNHRHYTNKVNKLAGSRAHTHIPPQGMNRKRNVFGVFTVEELLPLPIANEL